MLDVKNNINYLREWLDEQNFDAIIIPHQDEYLSEYLPPENERLKWATGFTGSAGVAIVGKDKASIFVDGRYTVQVQEQVDRNIFEILHLVDNPYIDWIRNNFPKDSKISYDPKLHTPIWLNNMLQKLNSNYSMETFHINPIDKYWSNRPLPKADSALLLEEQYSGESSQSKRDKIANSIVKSGNDCAFISKLDSIMWLLNIRGNDIPCNPVLLCSGVIHSDSSFDLYIDKNKLPSDFYSHVGDDVRVHELNEFDNIEPINNKKIMIDNNSSNIWSCNIFKSANYTIINSQDPCSLPKACKNNIEIQGMKECHIRDGVAVSRFLFWLDGEVNSGNLLDEEQLASKLDGLRSELDLFKGPSFGTISAAGSNAAMCHYSHKNSTVLGKLKMGSIYLVDSGGQYLDGTTDITRTVAIGDVPNKIKQAFTLVLKGHIALGCAIFPIGTSGHQLDALARQYLWEYGLDYDHGTGHGVGHFLNVHEGPQGVGKGGSDVPLAEGMVISNEPGYYLENEYGIRCENLVFVKKNDSKKSNTFLQFEDLTMVPFDKRLFDMSLLTKSDIIWINDYHQKVYNNISKRLSNQQEIDWLKEATNPIN